MLDDSYDGAQVVFHWQELSCLEITIVEDDPQNIMAEMVKFVEEEL